MSNQPEQIPPPSPPTQDQSDNPYAGRDHESGGIRTKEDVLAVAGLLGATARELGQIDTQNVGGDSQFIKAKKIDPKQALQSIVGASPQSAPSPQPALPPMPAPVNQPAQPVHQSPAPALEQRITELEKSVAAYKKVLKFKRGVSYTINTVNIKGEFKSPGDILDIISNELAKGTKTITIKLNDTTKNK